MGVKRSVALFLCLLLFLGVARADALRPRRDDIKEIAAGPAASSLAEIEAVEPETPPVAEAETLGSLHGRFSIARGLEARNWEFEATLTRRELRQTAGEGEAELRLEAWAEPAQEGDVRVELSFWGLEDCGILTDTADVACPVAICGLRCVDTQSGEARAHYMLELQSDETLSLCDELRGEELWRAQLPYGTAFLLSAYDADLTLDGAAFALMMVSMGYLWPLSDAFRPLSDGGEVTIALRELLMPFSRMFGLSLVELFPPSDIAPDSAQLSRTLAHLLRGEVTITPTDGGLSAVYYSEGSPELSDAKLEAALDESGLRTRLYENTENGYAAVARADLTALDDGLRLRAEDYAHGGFFYLDVNMPAYEDAQMCSLTALMSASPRADGPVQHARLEWSRVPDADAQLMRPDAPMPCSASLILSGEEGPTRFSLFFEETFSD